MHTHMWSSEAVFQPVTWPLMTASLASYSNSTIAPVDAVDATKLEQCITPALALIMHNACTVLTLISTLSATLSVIILFARIPRYS